MERRWALNNITAQRVLKIGMVKLHEVLSARGTPAELLSMPRLVNGNGGVQKQAADLFSRLLLMQHSLKEASSGDVAAAQFDLRHLRLEQLLAIRVNTLDFATESSSHTAHIQFLEMLDRRLFEHLARRQLNGGTSASEKVASMFQLGLDMVHVLGAIEVLQRGLSSEAGPASTKSAEPEAAARRAAAPAQADLPVHWALELDRDKHVSKSEAASAPECLALFNTKELWVEMVEGEKPDFASLSGGDLVALIGDRSAGIGKDKMLHWNICAVDPRQEDVKAEVMRMRQFSFNSQGRGTRALGDELHQAVRQRTRGLDHVFESAEKGRTADAAGTTSSSRLAWELPRGGSVTALVQSLERMSKRASTSGANLFGAPLRKSMPASLPSSMVEQEPQSSMSAAEEPLPLPQKPAPPSPARSEPIMGAARVVTIEPEVPSDHKASPVKPPGEPLEGEQKSFTDSKEKDDDQFAFLSAIEGFFERRVRGFVSTLGCCFAEGRHVDHESLPYTHEAGDHPPNRNTARRK